jgi:hypothetical protein
VCGLLFGPFGGRGIVVLRHDKFDRLEASTTTLQYASAPPIPGVGVIKLEENPWRIIYLGDFLYPTRLPTLPEDYRTRTPMPGALYLY